MFREAMENRQRMMLWGLQECSQKLERAYKLRWVWKGIVAPGTVKYRNGQLFDCKLQAYSIRTRALSSYIALISRPGIQEGLWRVRERKYKDQKSGLFLHSSEL